MIALSVSDPKQEGYSEYAKKKPQKTKTKKKPNKQTTVNLNLVKIAKIKCGKQNQADSKCWENSGEG